MQSTVLEPAYREHWEKAIDETINLFVGLINQHNEQGGHKPQLGDSDLNYHTTQAYKEMGVQQVSAAQVEIFKVSLKNFLYSEAEEVDKSEFDEDIVISIDYSPEEALLKCLTDADIPSRVLPLKSVVRVNPFLIDYKIGYGSDWKQINIE